MEVFLKAYLEKNLGDDLFISIIADRYRNVRFTAFSYQNYDKIKDNLIVKSHSKIRLVVRILNKLIREFRINKYIIPENRYKKNKDMLIHIGGSLFCEKDNITYWKNTLNLEYYKCNLKYYILGSNFGPYNNDEFVEIMSDFFSRAQDVCFREEYSYNLFKHLSNVRYASDIVFSMDVSNVKITNNKKVVISVIECGRKSSIEYKDKYENKIIEICRYFAEKDYGVTLMSYCKAEKDEEAIESILEKCDDKLKEKISTYYYRGSIEEALNIMGDCQIVIGSRFHANIIGLLLGKTIIPIAYSDKTINTLKDMNFKGKILRVQDIDKFDINSLTKEDLNYKHDISFEIKDSQRQFEKLDEILNKDV